MKQTEPQACPYSAVVKNGYSCTFMQSHTFLTCIEVFFVYGIYYWLRCLPHFGSGASLAQPAKSCVRHIAVANCSKLKSTFSVASSCVTDIILECADMSSDRRQL